MFKVTLIFLSFLFFSCHSENNSDNLDEFERQLNKDSESRIDAAYLSITKHCDSLFTYELPARVDSILKTDSLK